MPPLLPHALLLPLLLFLLHFPPVPARLLEGRTLRCCTLPEAPFIIADGTRRLGFDGIAMKYLSKLQEKLGFNCTYLIEYTEQGANNTLFTSFIHHMHRCAADGVIPRGDPTCKCDIGVGGWGINNERRILVDFVQPFAFDQYRVATHVDNTFSSSGGAFFLTTFSPSVWVSIFVLILLFTFLKVLDRRFAPPPKDYRPLSKEEASFFRRRRHYLLHSKIPFRLRRAVQDTLMQMIGQSPPSQEHGRGSTRQWALNFVIVLCGLFLILAYEAIMTASLVQESVNSRFKGVDSFKTCTVKPEDVCFPEGGAVEAYWKYAIAPKSCHQEPGLKKPNPLPSYGAMMAAAASGKCKYAMAAGGTLQYAAETRFCGELTITGEPFFGGGISFVLPRNSDLKVAFDSATLELSNEDEIPTVESYVKETGGCETRNEAVLTFRKLQLFFIFSFAACFIMFLEMIFDPQEALSDNASDENGDTENGYTERWKPTIGDTYETDFSIES